MMKKIVLLLVIGFIASSAIAYDEFDSSASGDWKTYTSWKITTGAGGVGYPVDRTDYAAIKAHTITLDTVLEQTSSTTAYVRKLFVGEYATGTLNMTDSGSRVGRMTAGQLDVGKGGGNGPITGTLNVNYGAYMVGMGDWNNYQARIGCNNANGTGIANVEGYLIISNAHQTGGTQKPFTIATEGADGTVNVGHYYSSHIDKNDQYSGWYGSNYLTRGASPAKLDVILESRLEMGVNINSTGTGKLNIFGRADVDVSGLVGLGTAKRGSHQISVQGSLATVDFASTLTTGNNGILRFSGLDGISAIDVAGQVTIGEGTVFILRTDDVLGGATTYDILTSATGITINLANVRVSGAGTLSLNGNTLQMTIPEPMTLSLLGLGGLVLRRRRR